jgi:hypothetical protein
MRGPFNDAVEAREEARIAHDKGVAIWVAVSVEVTSKPILHLKHGMKAYATWVLL